MLVNTSETTRKSLEYPADSRLAGESLPVSLALWKLWMTRPNSGLKGFRGLPGTLSPVESRCNVRPSSLSTLSGWESAATCRSGTPRWKGPRIHAAWQGSRQLAASAGSCSLLKSRRSQ